MKQEEWQQELEKQRSNPLCYLSENVPLSKYQHIERLGHADCDGLIAGEVTIQNKIDGANLTVAYSLEKGVVIASRNQVVSVGRNPDHGFNGAVEYILGHEKLLELIRGDWVLRGEWLIRHSISYAANNLKHFWVFDVQVRQENGYMEYLSPEIYIPILEAHEIKYIPTLCKLTNPEVEDLVKLVDGPDEFGAEQKEGIVIKRYDFVNRFGRTTWAKLVSADFKEKNRMTFGGSKKDSFELNFASESVTEELVMKTIYKIKDANDGEISIRKMSEVLGRVWYDVFQDHLWLFVKKHRRVVLDFVEARRLVEKFTREYALDYFNGVKKGE